MPDARYAVLLRLARPDLLETITDAEAAALHRHFAHLQRAMDAGTLLTVGRCPDRSRGVSVLKTKSRADARALVDADPAVREGVLAAELRPWRDALVVSA